MISVICLQQACIPCTWEIDPMGLSLEKNNKMGGKTVPMGSKSAMSAWLSQTIFRYPSFTVKSAKLLLEMCSWLSFDHVKQRWSLTWHSLKTKLLKRFVLWVCWGRAKFLMHHSLLAAEINTACDLRFYTIDIYFLRNPMSSWLVVYWQRS